MRRKQLITGLRYCSAPLTRKFLLAVLILVLTVPAFAKMYEQPRSFSLKDDSQQRVERKLLPRFDAKPLVAEDQARAEDVHHPSPHRFAIASDVLYTLDNSGTWRKLSDGRLWRLRIRSPSATSLNLGITRIDIPKGAKLWIYEPGHTHVEGPYTSRNRSHLGSLWTPVIQGDELVVELFVPTGTYEPRLEVREVNQGYAGFPPLVPLFPPGIPGAPQGKELSCEIDVICPQGDPWHDQIRAVGVYTLNGTATCSGTLMNNTAVDFKPYFLSANHCGIDSTNDATVVVYWNYQSPTCGTHGPGSTADNQTGSTYLASYAPSDFVLIELSEYPDTSFGVFYAGWDATGTAPSSNAVGIHHPMCDVKAISFSDARPYSSDVAGNAEPAGNHWTVYWTQGAVEHGSSGSCMFLNATKRCIGQLHASLPYCGAAQATYGQLSASWTGGDTPTTRLKDWLDPVNSGVLVLDGAPVSPPRYPSVATPGGTH